MTGDSIEPLRPSFMHDDPRLPFDIKHVAYVIMQEIDHRLHRIIPPDTLLAIERNASDSVFETVCKVLGQYDEHRTRLIIEYRNMAAEALARNPRPIFIPKEPTT